MGSLATRGPRAKGYSKYVFSLSGERKSIRYSEPHCPKCRFSLGGERKSTGTEFFLRKRKIYFFFLKIW